MDALVAKRVFEREAVRDIRDNQELLALRCWQVLACEFPVLVVKFAPTPSGRAHTVMVDAHDFGAQALRWNLVKDAPGSPEVPGKPFVCVVGLIDYHSHQSHLNDPFDNYRYLVEDCVRKVRSGYTMAAILQMLERQLLGYEAVAA